MRSRVKACALATAILASAAAPSAAAVGGDSFVRAGDKGVVVGDQPKRADNGIVIRRDPTKAVPFKAVIDPTPAPGTTSASSDSFDWGDAAVGAGAGLLAAALAGGSVFLSRGRRWQMRRSPGH
jgi:hypothetical protein